MRGTWVPSGPVASFETSVLMIIIMISPNQLNNLIYNFVIFWPALQINISIISTYIIIMYIILLHYLYYK